MEYRLRDWDARADTLEPGDLLAVDLVQDGEVKRRVVAAVLGDGSTWGAYVGGGLWDHARIVEEGARLHSGTARFFIPRWFYSGRYYTGEGA